MLPGVSLGGSLGILDAPSCGLLRSSLDGALGERIGTLNSLDASLGSSRNNSISVFAEPRFNGLFGARDAPPRSLLFRLLGSLLCIPRRLA